MATYANMANFKLDCPLTSSCYFNGVRYFSTGYDTLNNINLRNVLLNPTATGNNGSLFLNNLTINNFGTPSPEVTEPFCRVPSVCLS